MNHYTFADQLHGLYLKACKLYAAGQRGAQTYFSPSEAAFLISNGITAQSIYDYAEDNTTSGGEPGWNKALTIESIRRDYFLNIQKGNLSPETLDAASMPDKTAALKGITWLPRLLPKARAKLRGELPATLMYCCAGDRRFFQENNIHPAEFLSLIWRHGDNDAAIADWVVARNGSK